MCDSAAGGLRRAGARLKKIPGALACIVLLCAATASLAQSPVVKVEEDWELIVGEPDPATLAPQATCVFSPVGNADQLYAALDINHHSQPQFSSGGLQLQVWSNNEPAATAEMNTSAKLQQNNEKVCWTQQMTLSDGSLTFAVINGQSDTWGAFDAGPLSITGITNLANLNSYDPNVSVQNSGVGFAANRVKSFVLKKVRKYTTSGDFVEDSTERIVYKRD